MLCVAQKHVATHKISGYKVVDATRGHCEHGRLRP